MAYAYAVSIPAGQTAAVRGLMDEVLAGPRKADYDDLQRRCGVTGETYWLQPDSVNGDTLVVVSEGAGDSEARFERIMADPQTDFDRWYRQRLLEIMMVDVAAPGPPNELMGRWGA